ncbi:flavin oxidoreductase [Leptolyngbyaceae cyanobacterium CCMR0082]|uniref:Flavin oxidoreductase n=2 Tax=Adonisia turfae TaxID=2950184 RepID=A0A6M0RZX5_9CYAN|nr:diflavin flavoprotein [Adonisia turfae]MDV3351923.1 diflavin flavoprotein [Leptothoe sp. LEGE 181152]NEZ57773.1 flavin oxidoreductase [Adonisia turfae CCMR0081]NEZ61221.1 flavin oxidoreductase [Adonisia turfae CCMR0082]
MTETKQRDVQVLPIATNTLALRSRSWNRLRFEIEYALEKGTTANSYLINADQIALIDPPGGSFTTIFLDALRSHVALDQLDYIILGHINPNRLETLQHLVNEAPQVTIVCSNPGAIAIKAAELSLQNPLFVIKNADEVLDLGQDHKLQFMPVPTPRWPDGLTTYDPASCTLYTDKFFSAHICNDDAYDLRWEDLLNDRRYYFDTVMAPNAKQVATALEKLSEFPAHLYGAGHGPMVKYGIHELTHQYQQWCAQQKQQTLSVALIYASAYGNTATIGQAIARGITKAGVAVESINAEQAPQSDIKTAAETCAGFIIGSPTLGGHAPTQIQTALGLLLSTASKNKLAGVFGSYGWSGEAIDLLESKLRDGGYSFGFDPIRVKFKPDEVTLKYCEEAGTDFAQALKKAKRAKAPRTPASNVEKAVGRLVGSLCVMTAKQSEVASAMLASWVAQATFTPPGFTVAVAKERAIETLIYPGNPFVLNILGEGKHLGPMKQFLKSFTPGENRFEGIDIEVADNGAYILKDAIAYLECTVKHRMDCGDHWVVYATIDSGQVLDNNAKTAVHHRKSGNHY